MTAFALTRSKPAPVNAKVAIGETLAAMSKGDSFLAEGVLPKSVRTYISMLKPRGQRFVTRAEGQWLRVWRVR